MIFMRLLLVCSSGGHLQELYALKEFWQDYPRIWVTFDTKDAKALLEGEKVINAYHPTNRSIKNLLRNFELAFWIFKNVKPTIVISTGAGVAVPFIYIAKLHGIKTIYVESITRINNMSLTGHIIYPVIDHFLVQWPELAAKYRNAIYKGSIA